MNKRIALVTNASFPIGGPETNRFLTYCKVFAERGIYTKVYSLLPTEEKRNIVNSKKEGVYQGVHYLYLSPLVKKENESRWHKGGIALCSLYRLFWQLKKDKIDVIILYWGPSVIVYSALWFYSKILRASLLIDRGEYPSLRENLTALRDWKERSIFKYFDGLIVMADKLVIYYDQIKSKKAKLFQLPMTVDIDRFKGVAKENVKEKYIVCIFGSHGRDCIMDTVRAYEFYHAKYNDDSLRLWLIGNIDKLPDAKEIRGYIEEHDLTDWIKVKGILPSNELPQILVNAEAAITTAREYSSGGFPSKLGEYLASGTLVIATNAGEIPLYLTHKVNALLASPADINGLAENIGYLHDNPQICEEIGREGLATANKYFNVYTYIDDLLVFLQKLSFQRQ